MLEIKDVEQFNYVLVLPHTEGDTRTAEEIPSFSDFTKANRDHRSDVQRAMCSIADIVERRGERHDWTKTDYEFDKLFYADFVRAMNGEIRFEDGWWYRHHTALERHHLDTRVPDDVNLIDILEMICDQVCTNKARNPDVDAPINIDPDVLTAAVDNTIALVRALTLTLPPEARRKE